MSYRKLLGRHRSALMGIASLLIVLFHSSWHSGVAALDVLIDKAGIGVDFFVFLSGFGLAHALHHRPDFYDYYRRRARRVLPAYYAVYLAMMAVGVVTTLLGQRSGVGEWGLLHLLPVSVWLNRMPKFWYVSATMGYYALAPLIYRPIRHARHPRLAAAILLAIAALWIPAEANMGEVIKVLARLPALVMGIAVGVMEQDEAGRHPSGNALGLACLVLSGAAGIGLMYLLWRAGAAPFRGELLSRMVLDLFAPLLCVLLAALAELVERSPMRLLNAGLSRLGQYSLEIYLGHILVRDLINRSLHLPSPALLLLLLALAWPVALCVRFAAERLLRLWDWAAVRLRRPEENRRDGEDGQQAS